MGIPYTIEGIPSDLLTSDKIGSRKLKVDASVTAAPESPLDALYNKSYTYTPTGYLATITTLDTSTGLSTLRTLTWVNGNVVSDVTTAI